MGNWRTVHVTGTMTAKDAAALREHLGYSYDDMDAPQWKRFGPLSFSAGKPSLCGLNDWPAEQVNRSGNLAERDYSPEDVAGQLRELVGIAPSMMIVIHCGGDWESLRCAATIRVGEGVVAVGKPEVAQIEEMPESEAIDNLLRAIGGGY